MLVGKGHVEDVGDGVGVAEALLDSLEVGSGVGVEDEAVSEDEEAGGAAGQILV